MGVHPLERRGHDLHAGVLGFQREGCLQGRHHGAGAGFDSESNGVYAVTLKKTQKVTKGRLKGGTNVWVAELMIDTTAGWDACQIPGDYCTKVWRR